MVQFTRTSSTSVWNNQYCEAASGVPVVRPSAISLTAKRTGEPIPKFKQLIKDKLPAISPLAAYTQSCKFVREGAVEVKRNAAYGSTKFTDTSMGLTVTTYTDSQVKTMTNSLIAAADAVALRNLHNKIQAIQSPFQTQVFAAELHQVRQLLRGPLNKYGNLLMNAVRSRNKMLRQTKVKTQDLSDLWLELQFGVIPLIRDISDIAKLFNEKTDDQIVSRIKAFGSASSATDSSGTASLVQGVSYKQQYVTESLVEVFYHSGVAKAYQEKLTGIEALSHQLTSLMEVPATVWELVPWSFLVDYFVNVGDIINSTTTASNSLSYVSRSVVQTVTVKGLSQFVSFNKALSVYVESVDPKQPAREYESKTRVVTRTGGQLAIPPLVVTLPGSNHRYANIAALLHQLFSK